MPSGYSNTPLQKKLGLKPGQKVLFLDPPEGYTQTLRPLPEGITRTDSLTAPLDFIHFFTKSQDALTRRLPALKAALAPDGMLWISWPKQASRVQTDLNGNVVRQIGLANGLVDVKVAAIDEIWSGLKFVYRVEDRG